MNLLDIFAFQFIDGRLAKLNSGRGFSDVFEEEITSGGFCGGNAGFPCDFPFFRQRAASLEFCASG